MKYLKIKTQKDLDTFLKKANYLEDAIIKEVVFLNHAYVDKDFLMFGDDSETGSNVKILIQTQWKDVPVVELLCTNVEYIALDYRYDLGVYGIVGPNKTSLYFDETQSKTNSIVSQSVEYRFLGESFLGNEAFLSNWNNQ
ncbi:MAG: hypothetical protein ACYTET_00845 [Planctomycetota bacterium]|jgi:hypothetical protein